MQHTEPFVTEVLEKVASRLVDATAPEGAPRWDDLDMYQRQQIKQDMLGTVLTVLDAAKEVRGEVPAGSCWRLLDDEVAKGLLAAEVDTIDNHGRSAWMWIRDGAGGLALGIYPQGDTYELLDQGPAAADFDAALDSDTVCWHTTTVDD